MNSTRSIVEVVIVRGQSETPKPHARCQDRGHQLGGAQNAQERLKADVECYLITCDEPLAAQLWVGPLRRSQRPYSKRNRRLKRPAAFLDKENMTP